MENENENWNEVSKIRKTDSRERIVSLRLSVFMECNHIEQLMDTLISLSVSHL